MRADRIEARDARLIARIVAREQKSAGGWQALARRSGIAAGSLLYIAEGRRRPSPSMRIRLERAGLTPHRMSPDTPAWRETVAAIVAWAEQPPPRKRWTSYAGKAR